MRQLISTGALVTAIVCVLASASPAPDGQKKGPELFEVGVLNTESDEYGPMLSAQGDELFFTIRRNRRGSEHVVVSRRVGGAWSAPVSLPFSGNGYDKEPYLSPYGNKLFFASKRPVPSGANLDFEIWVSDRVGDSWSEPRHVEAVGSPGYDNYPAVAANGNLYFGSARIEGKGRIFRAVWNGKTYDTPEVVLIEGEVQLGGADPYIDPEERFMVFSSTRSGGFGEGDLYLTVNNNDRWSEPVNLGPVINTTTYEFTPFVSQDNRYLYFSRGWGEMWRILIAEVEPLSQLLRE
jgi:Tol biopolymer transport system component